MKFVITPQQFEYLAVQRGGISHLANDFALWKEAYEEAIESDFNTMLPLLPKGGPASLLDIGGGLSGISARINKHYEDSVRVAVLDGREAKPEVVRHNLPFNSEAQTLTFLKANGVSRAEYLTPDQKLGAYRNRQYEVIISTQAWCFHIEPELYLEEVKKALLPTGVLIVDVRRDEGRVAFLHEHFVMLGGLAFAEKWVRVAFMRRDE